MKAKITLTTTTLSVKCPKCQETLNMHSGDGSPTPGDFTLCSRCGELLRFGLLLELTIPDESGVQELRDSGKFQNVFAVQKLIRFKNAASREPNS